MGRIWVLLSLVIGAQAQAQTAAEVAKPVFTMKADKGFIDDPFALDPDSDRLAVLRTDSASFARLEVTDLATGKLQKIIAVGDPQQLFDRVMFAGPEGGVVVVTRHSGTGKRSAQHIGMDGRPAGFAGPAADFGLATRGGQRYLVAWDQKTGASGETSYTVTQHKLAGLARVGKSRGLVVGKDGMFKQPPFKLVTWQDGYSQIVGVKPGGFDAKKDSRQPDKAAVFDVLQGSFVSESEVADILAWVYATSLRKTRPNRTLLAVVSDEQDAMQLVDAMGKKTKLPLAAPFPHYDLRSLQEQEDPASGSLYFSLSVDPLHPDALARQKADKAYLDLYRARPPGENVRLVRTTLDERPVSWAVGPRFVVILRKHKSFSRGGSDLEVYSLAAK